MMNKLMEELIAEASRVQNLETEVARTVAMQKAQIKADRTVKMERPRKFISEMGWNLAKLGKTSDRGGYYPEIPLNVFLRGQQLFVNYSIEFRDGEKRLYVYGGFKNQIQFRVISKDIHPDYERDRDFVDAIIDQWDDECESKLEAEVMEIMKKNLSQRIAVAQNRLAKSNDAFDSYFGKED